MKAGDLVRFKPWPHKELHSSGMTGVILDEPYLSSNPDSHEMIVDVMWSEVRGTARDNVTWDYADDLEVIK